MKKNYKIFSLGIILLISNQLYGQTVWNGPSITFAKSNGADYNLATNQDRITSNVWLTRKTSRGLFNIKVEESSYLCPTTNSPQPSDTEWAYGTSDNYSSLTFQTLNNLIQCGGFSGIVNGENMVLHLISDDIYLDLKFTFWGSGGSGGGFSYERSTDPSINSLYNTEKTSVNIFPNPSSNFLKITGVSQLENFTIYNIIGSEIINGSLSNNDKIDISQLKKGVYFFKIIGGQTIKFSKK